MSEVIRVTSEALQSTIRDLLPSQNGFGDDLMASNVIIPTIDLTASAEGSSLPFELNNALAFGSQTAFNATNSTAVIANTAGFYRIFGAIGIATQTSVNVTAKFTMSDGLSTKTIYELASVTSANRTLLSEKFDFVVFLNSGESISAVSDNGNCIIGGSSRQIADINGILTVPNGFSPQ